MVNVTLNDVNVNVTRLDGEPGKLAGKFQVSGVAYGSAVNETIKFYHNGDFDTEMDEDLAGDVFLNLDERGWEI